MINIYAGKMAETVLSEKAVKLNIKKPFLWESGHVMPIYNDIQLLLLDPGHRRLVAEGFKALIDHHQLKFHFVMGTSLSSTPYAAVIADLLETPLICVEPQKAVKNERDKLGSTAAWNAVKNKQVLLIQDIVSTGDQLLTVVNEIRNYGGKVNECLSIFNYCLLQTEELFTSLSPELVCHAILTYEIFLEAALDQGYIKAAQQQTLLEWREDPFGWAEKHGFSKTEKGK